MLSLYELLKASKGLPVSDSYAALWGKSAAESGIKTLTGRLPIFFRTSENKLRDWVIYGNNDVGKNLLEITAESQTVNGVVFTVDKQAGTVTTNRESASSSDAILAIDIPDELKGQNLYFSGCPSEGSASTYNVYALDYDTASRAPQWDGTTLSETDYGTSNNEVRFVESHKSQLRLRIKAGYDAQNVVFKPMIRKADTSADFEPYQVGVGERTENGYVLNIGVGVAPISSQPVPLLYTRKTINLGESPLTKGQTLSMSEFGDIETVPYTDIFIAAVEGFNLEDQLSYNQPEMKIKYKEVE